MAAAASAFCTNPAVARALTQRTAGLPPRLEAGLQQCAARFARASGEAAVLDSLASSEDALQQVRNPATRSSKHMPSSIQRWLLMFCNGGAASVALWAST